MPITDKIAAAKKISELLNGIITTGDFRLRYKIMVDPPAADHDFAKPEIKVELSGRDSPLVLERGGELLRAFEHVALEMLRLGADEHDKVVFDCENFRSARLQELRMSANVAADRVRQSGMPYAFAPMSSRERRTCASRFARHRRPAHRKRGRSAAALRRGLSQGLQGQAARTSGTFATQIDCLHNRDTTKTRVL